MNSHHKRGFTLNELLVVIAIIGILASVVSASLLSTKEKSRDAKKVAELKVLEQAVELYFQENYRFPDDIDGLKQYYVQADFEGKIVASGDFLYDTNDDATKYCIGVKTVNLTNTDTVSCVADTSLGIDYKYIFTGP